MKYKRILLKISGEAFADSDGRGIDRRALDHFYAEIKNIVNLGVQVALVNGGGNFWRERDFRELSLMRTTSDTIGMVATMMNGLAIKAFLDSKGVISRVFSAKGLVDTIESYTLEKANKALNKGELVILTGGTGHPFFTTDSAAVLRALELNCEVILKGTKVDGVYDTDPVNNPNAKKYSRLSYEEAIANDLKILDKTAFALAIEKRTPLIVFNVFEKGSLLKVIQGAEIGTLVF